MSDVPMSQYIWKDGAVHAGGWSRTSASIKTGERKPRRNASRVRFETLVFAACPCWLRRWGTRPNHRRNFGQGPRLRGVERQPALCARHTDCRRSAGAEWLFRQPQLTPAKSWRNSVRGIRWRRPGSGNAPLTGGDVASGGRRGIDFLKERAPAPRRPQTSCRGPEDSSGNRPSSMDCRRGIALRSLFPARPLVGRPARRLGSGLLHRQIQRGSR